MFPIDQIDIIKLIINTLLAIKPEENVLIIADRDENVEIAALLAAEAKSVGAQVALTILGPRKGLHHEPPKFVAESMKHADIVIGVIYSLLHTKARREAQAAGVRFAVMGGVRVGEGKEHLANLNFDINDLRLIEERGKKLADMITGAKTARMTCDLGTNLTMSLLDRKGLAILPICRDPKVFTILVDYSEVACAPVEGSAEGTLVIDGTVVGLQEIDRVVQQPITFKIKQGRIEGISGGKDARDLEEVFTNADFNAKCVAELGIGTNHNIMKLRGVVRDKANLGTIHIAFGKNDFIGGIQDSELHIDFMVTKPTLKLDDVLVIDKGKLIL
jgi:leucyl aminopeptidase (aminopeptidase T)